MHRVSAEHPATYICMSCMTHNIGYIDNRATLLAGQSMYSLRQYTQCCVQSDDERTLMQACRLRKQLFIINPSLTRVENNP